MHYSTLALAVFFIIVSGSESLAQTVPMKSKIQIPTKQKKQPEEIIKIALPKTWYHTSYETAIADAKRTGKSLVVFVGIAPRKVDGAVVAGVSKFTRVGGSVETFGIFVTRNLRDAYWFDGGTSDAAIRSSLGMGVQASPAPFSGKPQSAERDDKPLAAGPWPKSLPFPDGLRRYRRALFTQEIAVTDNRDRITPIRRTSQQMKWQVPGGLEGVSGWRSELYKFLPERQRTWVDNILVLNSAGDHQANRGYLRLYPRGTLFADVLINDKTNKVFEVRYAEKLLFRWDRYIAYRDVKERPAGYVPPTSRQCVACHAMAGTGNYAAPLIPGGDTVLSDGFDELEG